MAKRPKALHQLTAAQFDGLFKTEDDCVRYLVARRWSETVVCPRCGNPKVYALASGHHWQCTQCAPGGSTGYRFSHLTGTIFENTNKPLRDWFKVTHLMLVSKKGMSALQIYRYMGFGSYKTAWLMCHKIRCALIEDVQKLGGIVEIDETFIGGKDSNRHWDKRVGKRGAGHDSKKTPVAGAVQRKGNVVARVVQNVKASTA
jgi:transposase-like protein